VNNGWVKLHRQLADHPRAKDPDWLAVWLRLLLLATHKECKMIFGKELITLKPGQLITSRKSLQMQTGVNESKIERVLTCLKTEHQIEQQSSSISRLITILNWSKFQDYEQANEQHSNSIRTASEQRVNTNKNVKNVRMKEEGTSTLTLFPPEVVAELNIPQHLRTEAFLKVWSDWVQFRKSNFKKCKDWMKLFQYTLDYIKDFPEATAISMVTQSLRNGWQSIRELNAPKWSGNGERSIMDLKSVMGAKENKAATIKRKYCSDVAMGETWSDPKARMEYHKLKKEITELNDRISQCH
jgi:DNA-binding transcriptional regulator YhcF (GntR family)